MIPFAWTLANDQYRSALVLFFVAAATDGLDGLLARVCNWKTRLGAIADPLADKLLMLTTFLMLSLTDVLPLWLFGLVLGRDLVIVGGAAFRREPDDKGLAMRGAFCRSLHACVAGSAASGSAVPQRAERPPALAQCAERAGAASN